MSATLLRLDDLVKEGERTWSLILLLFILQQPVLIMAEKIITLSAHIRAIVIAVKTFLDAKEVSSK